MTTELHDWVDKLYALGFTPIPIRRNSKVPNGLAKGELTSYHRRRPNKKQIE